MPRGMVIEDFNNAIDSWINEVTQNTFGQICAKPSPTSWSLGQVSMHLMEATRHYLEEINTCLSGNDHILEEMSLNAKTMFRNNAFPDELIEDMQAIPIRINRKAKKCSSTAL